MPERHQDWLSQARRDLEHARVATREGHHEWAAFAAQQAAEKACKALHLALGGAAWGHDVTHLLEALPGGMAGADLLDRAKALDKHYLPARYPSGFAAGTPHEHYTRREAEQAIADAEAIVESSVSVRYPDMAAILSAIRSAAARIGADHPEVVEVRLFGSLARGDPSPYADADLLVILDRSDLAPRDRLPRYRPAGIPVPLDLLVCTREELARELAAGNRFLGRVMAGSRVLFSRAA
jgi:HEPN domain-containing protein